MKTLSLHILDIVQNSIRANAGVVSISIQESIQENKYIIRIEDNGDGMDSETLKKVSDPFYTSRTTRNVGLGLSLLKQHAEMTGGKVEIDSALNQGTVVTAHFTHNHLDRQELGDIEGVIVMLLEANPGLEFIYKHETDKGSYAFSSIEVKKEMELKDLTYRPLLKMLKEMINENLKAINVK